MNETQGGTNPSGYFGTGHGMAQNRLLAKTPLPPSDTVQADMLGGVQADLPGGVQPSQAMKAGQPWWHAIGLPAFHVPSTSEPPLGVLGIKFSPRNSSGWGAV